MKVIKYFFAVCIVLLYGGCTKEVPVKPEEKDWWKMDLSGYWNAYRYTDGSGLVPLEVIEIKKGATNEWIATKIVGDNSVPSGHVTWHGFALSNPFKVDCFVGNGLDIHEEKDFADIFIESENILRTKGFFGLMLVRRTDGYFP